MFTSDIFENAKSPVQLKLFEVVKVIVGDRLGQVEALPPRGVHRLVKWLLPCRAKSCLLSCCIDWLSLISFHLCLRGALLDCVLLIAVLRIKHYQSHFVKVLEHLRTNSIDNRSYFQFEGLSCRLNQVNLICIE